MLSKVGWSLLGKNTLVTEQNPRQSAPAKNSVDLHPQMDASTVYTSLVETVSRSFQLTCIGIVHNSNTFR